VGRRSVGCLLELVFLLVGLIFGADTGALVMGMSSPGNPDPGDEPRS
jgi:hypothetical protein